MDIEEMQRKENFEHEVLDRLKCLSPVDFDYNAVHGSYVDAVLKARDIILTAYEKEKEKNKELESDIQQKNFEIKCLNSDIKNMYCEEGVIAILEDNFDLTREEAIQILEEE